MGDAGGPLLRRPAALRPCTAGFAPAPAAAAEGPSAPATAAATAAEGDFVVLAHARCNTGPTVYPVDPVGTLLRGSSEPWLHAAISEGAAGEAEIADSSRFALGDDAVVDEEGTLPLRDRRRVVDYVPVRCDGEPVAVLAREAAPAPIRHENPLETIYRGVYTRFAEMIATGAFPYDRMERVGEFREPRVGDGVILFDREGRISYASPNARSAMQRLGVWSAQA